MPFGTSTEPALYSPRAAAAEAHKPRACAPQQEKPPTTATRKSECGNKDPAEQKIKLIKKKKKKPTRYFKDSVKS